MSRLVVLLLALAMPLVTAQARTPSTRDVASLEQLLSAQPHNIEVMQALAAALLAEVRITPRADLMARAETWVDRLLALHAPRADALDAWRLLILHRFDAALAAARRAQQAASDPMLAALCAADALTELGRYAEAERAVQDLLDHHYGSAALARASHLRRLFGDLPGAIELAEAALKSSATEIDRAWLTLDLAELQLMAGRPRLTLSLATTALRALPAPALVMQARAQQALGEQQAALALYAVAAARTPRVEYEVEILRLAQMLGDRKRVASTTRMLEAMARLATVGGGDRRSLVEFHLLEAQWPAATRLARDEWQQRPDVYSAAQLAWVLFRSDHGKEAAAYARRALALDTVDPALQWRAGTVLAAHGDARGALEVAAALHAQPWLADAGPLLARQP